jgi:hypothetical protein
MSNKRKTGFPLDLWRVDYIDRLNMEDSYNGEEVSREEAERRYRELTNNGTQRTEGDKNALGYYRLVQSR